MAVEKNNVVVVEHEFKAPVEKVFAAVKEGRIFYNCGAWPASKVDFKVGGKYSLDFGHYGTCTGLFSEIVENKRIVFTWNFGEDIRTTVTMEFTAKGTASKVKIRHEGFADAETAESHSGGWTEGLGGLDDELIGGKVRLEREFTVPVEMLYQACSSTNFFALLGATDANSKIDFRVGGRYNCQIDKDHKISGEFLEITKNAKVVFTWESAPCGTTLEKPTTVTMEFGPWGDDGKNSYLSLVHTGFTNSEAACSHQEGWNRILRKVYEQSTK